MNCQEFWNQAPESSRPPGAGFSAHLSECPACASAWARQQQRGCRAAPGGCGMESHGGACPAGGDGWWARFVRRRVLARVRRTRPWIGALTWATAAAAVLALAFSLVRVREPQTAAPKRVPANALILAALQEIPDGAGGFEATGLEAGFVPLPNVEQLAPSEQGDLVTVEVPRSAMIALGFEVSPERAAEPVQAEVMFGPDGVARAVRFLDETF